MTLPKETTMIDDVEYAIRDAVFATYDQILLNGGRELAIAALKAIRNATPEMIEAANYHGVRNAPFAQQFRAAMDAALNEGEG